MSQLDVECTPNIPPNLPLDSLSDGDLRGKVVAAEMSRERWRDPRADRVHDLRVANMPITQSREDAFFFIRPRMLPGGAGVFVVSDGTLMLHPLSRSESRWIVEGYYPSSVCLAFDFDLLPDGRTLRVATVDIEKTNFWRQMGET